MKILRPLVITAAIWMAGFTIKAQSNMPAPGQLVDVNGYKLHLITKGQGSIPVVMFHGAGDIALIWNLVITESFRIYERAVAVDQAGEGWSEHGHAIHMRQQAYDTYTLLCKMPVLKAHIF